MLLKLLQEIPTQRQVMLPTQEDNRNWLWLSRLAFHYRRPSASRPILEEEAAKEEEIANWEEEVNRTMTMTVVNKTRIRTVRNTKGFVLYFLMRKYTSMPYIGGISVRYK